MIRSTLLVVALCLGAALFALKAYDWHLMRQPPPVYPDVEVDRVTMRTAEVYPYTGPHMQPHSRERGNEVLWNRTYGDTYDVRSGDFGFWIDHPLENWPAKKPDEVRIILTGGSGAQGWGARTNEDMFYKLLPARLSRKGCTVEVINLAMGATVIYQNFIALNKWGHALQPDAIVSFSGHNELAVPSSTRSDDHGATPAAASLQRARSYARSPQWLKDLAEYFPGIVKRTGFGNFVRYFYLDDYAAEWTASYQKLPASTPYPEIVRNVSIPMYVHSLESIARDFPDAEIFGVFQPLYQMPDEYRMLIAEVQARTKRVTFLDLGTEWERHDFYKGSLVDSVHLSNEGHKLVTDYLAAFLEPWVAKRCATIGKR